MTQSTKLSRLLSRAEIHCLQCLLGAPTVQLYSNLVALHGREPTTVTLRQLLLNLYSEADLLSNPSSRNEIIDLLRPSEAQELAERLELPVDDSPWSAIKRASASKKSLTQIFDYFEVPPLPEVDSPRPISHSECDAEYPLFQHQREALNLLLPLLQAGRQRAVLHMPTGSGKTRTAMNLIAEHLRKAEKTIVVWLANSEELCSQAAEEFSRSWSHLGNRVVSLSRLWGGSSVDLEDINEGLLIASFASMYSRMRGSDPTWVSKVGSRASLVVMDEAHQAIAPSYQLVLEGLTCFNPNVALLGLTATPGRTWNDPAMDRKLAEFFDFKKVTLKVKGYSNPVDFLIANGYLAKPIFRQLEFNGIRLTAQDNEDLAISIEIPASILRKLADDGRRSIYIIRHLEDLAKRHRRILLFATTVEHAERLSAVLTGTGTACRSITSKTPAYTRSQAISWYREDSQDTRILANYGVLTTGFDAPLTSAALIARPTKSLVLFSQMVGRATRGIKAGGHAEAEIVTVVDTSLPGFDSMASAFNNWEDVW